MLLGRVVGEVWATRKEPKLEGLRFLIIRPIDPDGRLQDGHLVAVDVVGAGARETVMVCQGSSARQSEATAGKPVDAVVMAIVDDVHVEAERPEARR